VEDNFGPRPHVLNWRRQGIPLPTRPSLAEARTRFNGENQAGRTPNLIVFTDGSQAGNDSAHAVLRTGEADYAAVRDWFGGIDLPQGQNGDDQTTPRTALPVQVLMDPQAGGAYHYGCNATDLYIEPDPQLASGFMVAELVEVFEAAQHKGWACGQTNGEGLSRVLAAERNSNLCPDLAATYQAWWSNGHADYVNRNDATDQDENGNGCGTLFLFYLHSQLGFSWQQITTIGGGTLGETYQRLTGKAPTQGFNDFVSLVGSLDQGGQLRLPANGNPFPIGGATRPADPPVPGAVAGAGVPVPSGGGVNWALVLVALIVVIIVVLAIGVLALHWHM
jgi:hypothetical protein